MRQKAIPIIPIQEWFPKKRTQSFLSNDNTETETSKRQNKSLRECESRLSRSTSFVLPWHSNVAEFYVANLILMSFVVRILSLTLEKESLTTQCYLQKETTLYRRDTRHQAP